ncbi:carbohydrate ABC transporter permease [Halegenticoccus soli]|uniref:carbohydrate ABC transporter permease n=1 Tax=Halegenticoccus soli TaxID=1985678 RepID=UPI000C6D1F13|nr:carbohydrate ABC transporter permease [Halegenticoccus soli]
MTTAQNTEIESEGGPFTRWVRNAIDNPGKVHRAMFYVALVFFLFTTLFPIYWLVVLALTPNNLIVDMGVVPHGFNLSVFAELWELVPLHLYMFNSFVIATVTTVYVLLVSSLSGYAFGRLEFRGKGGLLLLLLIISFFPPAAFLLPLFKLFTGNVVVFGLHSPNLFNSMGAIIIPFSGLFLPLSVFILTTFYSQIPDGLEDAARVEGTTRFGALFRVIMPLSAPGLSTAGILTFIAVYNEFFFSFLLSTGDPENGAPLVWGILAFQGQYASMYNYMAAASLIGILPIALLVVVAQEKIVSGLTAGAIKE